MDLMAYAQARFGERPRPDWKHDTEVAYRRWMRDPTGARRDSIVLAISPGIWYVSYRYTNNGVARADAFDTGICAVAKALENFHPERSPIGVASVASYLMWGSELAMRRAAKAGLDIADMECSLDDYEDPAWLIGVTCERYDGRTPVAEVVRDAIASLPPSDGRIATWRLLDEMTWDEVIRHARQMGDTRTTRWGMINHFNKRIRPRIVAALRRAGYDEGDV